MSRAATIVPHRQHVRADGTVKKSYPTMQKAEQAAIWMMIRFPEWVWWSYRCDICFDCHIGRKWEAA